MHPLEFSQVREATQMDDPMKSLKLKLVELSGLLKFLGFSRGMDVAAKYHCYLLLGNLYKLEGMGDFLGSRNLYGVNS